jgi:hypothetical protein
MVNITKKNGVYVYCEDLKEFNHNCGCVMAGNYRNNSLTNFFFGLAT